MNKILSFFSKYSQKTGLLVAIIGLIVVFSFFSPHFLTLGNFLSILQAISLQGIIAVGLTMVLISGEIDISIGSAAAFASCLFVYLIVKLGISIPLAAILVLIAGILIGIFTGSLRMIFGIPSFIITLGMFTALRGGAYLITGGYPITPVPYSFNWLGSGDLYGIPIPAFFFAFIALVGYLLLSETTFGRYVFAVGGDEEVAGRSGIKVSSIKIGVFVFTGILTSFVGIMLSSKLLSGNPTVAQGWMLSIIAAVIIGGTSLQGGSGTITGTLLGIFFIGVLNNGMIMLGVSPYMQQVTRGVTILAAVLYYQIQTKSAQG